MAGPLMRWWQCTTCRRTRCLPHAAAAPVCCGQRASWIRTGTHTPPAPRFGQAPALDYAPSRDRYAPWTDAGGAPVPLPSLHEIRRIERVSEQQERNGEGQAVRFRLYSQTDRYENTFGDPPHRTPRLTRGARQILSAQVQTRDGVDAAAMGPGADDARASALDLGFDPHGDGGS